MRTTDDWIARHVPDTQEAVRQALDILERYGYTAGDLDYLLYEGQAHERDTELEEAIGLLARLREAGITIR
ncbi:hypothetical protein [Tepidiforma sp.]|jgi:hypothetical protein|uniref:hypothetical protein n=1 Tax=Tepidiforma sp. TaxID=2682230 RepID=UPI0021DDF9BB|nr:hypothetical protein [Tepidiforma sp.]MCX7616552.1 hypothetical protein [Tepidiforma sp.]GIW19267.1 MAG: hypothetical protein KatS3mg064_2424 [Tepidiforma sp.]